MNIGKARALFEQVASGEYHGSTVGEYLEAVKIVLDMETHNSISKKMIISVCKWLVEIAEKAVSPYRWIPVNERLPRDGAWNIFTDGKNISVERYKADAIDHFFPNGRWFQLDDVIAWMPLPEPYKPNKKQSGKEGA